MNESVRKTCILEWNHMAQKQPTDNQPHARVAGYNNYDIANKRDTLSDFVALSLTDHKIAAIVNTKKWRSFAADVRFLLHLACVALNVFLFSLSRRFLVSELTVRNNDHEKFREHEHTYDCMYHDVWCMKTSETKYVRVTCGVVETRLVRRKDVSAASTIIARM